MILRVRYALMAGGEPKISYGDLERHFDGWESARNVAEIREAVRHVRALKGMLIIPGDEDCRSAGSFFKNPVLTEAQHQELAKRAATLRFNVPSYAALEKRKKVLAA